MDSTVGQMTGSLLSSFKLANHQKPQKLQDVHGRVWQKWHTPQWQVGKNDWLVVYLPLWKIWVRQLEWLFPIYGKTCSKPPTRWWRSGWRMEWVFPTIFTNAISHGPASFFASKGSVSTNPPGLVKIQLLGKWNICTKHAVKILRKFVHLISTDVFFQCLKHLLVLLQFTQKIQTKGLSCPYQNRQQPDN